MTALTREYWVGAKPPPYEAQLTESDLLWPGAVGRVVAMARRLVGEACRSNINPLDLQWCFSGRMVIAISALESDGVVELFPGLRAVRKALFGIPVCVDESVEFPRLILDITAT